MNKELPIIEHDFRVKVFDMSDKELHQEIVGQWNATKDFDEDQMNIMIGELDRRSKAHEALDRMVETHEVTREVPGEVTRDVDAVNMSQDRVDETSKGEHIIDCTDEQLIEEVRRRGFVIKDAQIGRKWVGLAHREMQELMSIRFIDDAVLATEAKLKEKNT